MRARAQSCLTLCDPMSCSPPGSSVHGILQVRTLEWVAISASRGFSWSRNQTTSPAPPALASGFCTTVPPERVIFVFLCLTWLPRWWCMHHLTFFIQYDNLCFHPCCCKWHYFNLFKWLNNIPLCVCVCVYHIFIHSSVDGHLDGLAVINTAALNIGLSCWIMYLVSCWIMVLRYRPRSGIARLLFPFCQPQILIDPLMSISNMVDSLGRLSSNLLPDSLPYLLLPGVLLGPSHITPSVWVPETLKTTPKIYSSLQPSSLYLSILMCNGYWRLTQ